MYSNVSRVVSRSELVVYAKEFVRGWAAYLDPGTELRYRIHGQTGENEFLLAVVFTVHDKGDRSEPTMAPALMNQGLMVAGVWVADDRLSIRAVKLNYPSCLWSRESARVDAESAVVQAMKTKGRTNER